MGASHNPGHKPTTWGSALLRLRMERGWSHVELADQCGVSRGVVKSWEKGEAVPSKVQLKRLYGVLRGLRYFTHMLPSSLMEEVKETLAGAVQQARQQANVALADGAPFEQVRLQEVRVGWLPELPGPGDHAPPSLLAPLPRVATFGQGLRRARLAAGLSQTEVADLVGLEGVGQTVSAWELDKMNPVEDHYQQLLGLFPELDDVPKPEVRAITKPIGWPGHGREGHHSPWEAEVNPDPMPAPRLNQPREPLLLEAGEAAGPVDPLPAALARSGEAKIAVIRQTRVVRQLEEQVAALQAQLASETETLALLHLEQQDADAALEKVVT